MSAMSEQTIDIEGRAPDDVIPPRELHHVTFKTNRIDEMVAFYETLTGHQARFRNASFAAITFDGANHRMALLGLAPWTELPPEQALSLPGCITSPTNTARSTSCCIRTFASSAPGSRPSGR